MLVLLVELLLILALLRALAALALHAPLAVALGLDRATGAGTVRGLGVVHLFAIGVWELSLLNWAKVASSTVFAAVRFVITMALFGQPSLTRYLAK